MFIYKRSEILGYFLEIVLYGFIVTIDAGPQVGIYYVQSILVVLSGRLEYYFRYAVRIFKCERIFIVVKFDIIFLLWKVYSEVTYWLGV